MKTKALLLAAIVLCGPVQALHAASEVTIATGATKGGKLSGTNPKVFKATKPTANLSAKALVKTLNGGKGVTITTESSASGTGDLIIAVPLSKGAGRSATLTLNAAQDVQVRSAINATKDTLPIVFKAGRAIATTATITTNGGNVTVNTVEPFSVGAALNVGPGQILLESGSVESSGPQTITASLVQVPLGTAWRLHGSISGSLNVEGELSPGPRGTGSMQVNAGLTIQPNAITKVNLGGTSRGTNYGTLISNGAVTLGGALQIDCANGFEDEIAQAHNFTIVTGASITGTFAGLENGSRIFLPDELGSLKVTYTSTTVMLSDWQPIIIDQPWDPGLTDEGTLIYTNARIRGKRHYFRVHTEDTDIGAWRTRLNPSGGEADLYASRGMLPGTSGAQKRSNNVGPDGLVLNATEFQGGQEWFLMVYADTGTPWNLVTGRAFVQDLGTLQWTDGNANGNYDIGEPVIPSATGDLVVGGEGMRFYKATVPVGTPAWSLWLNGKNSDIAIRKSVVPFHSSPNLYDRKQSGQMLVVPPYLGNGAATYFLSIVGQPGDAVNLDSRIQEVTDVNYNSTVSQVSVPDVPYRVYRVQVPVDQIAWDVTTTTLTGDPNVAVRRASAPAEFDNDGFSEVPGTVNDSVTLVPSFLTNGAWFITVYGKSAYSFTLRNGPPEVTPIQFTDQKLNDRPFRAGWQFYALTDVPSQLGSVGWELQLTNNVPGTELAIRRNAVPSRWRSRVNGLSAVTVTAASDVSSITGLLQNPGHQADIWYVGVFMPTEPLGPFVLSCRPIEPPIVTFDGGTSTLTNLEPGSWSYVRVDVPANAAGWDVRVRDVVGGNPAMAVRRDQLPALDPSKQLSNLPGWTPQNNLVWPTGNQWIGGIDWTGLTLDGVNLPTGNRLVMGMGHPLEPGTYYVGVYNNSTATTSSFTIDSRGIGQGKTYPVTAINYDGGTATITDLAPREARYFKVTVPPNSPSWELLLDTTLGEAEMVVRRGAIPDFAASSGGNVYEPVSGMELEMVKTGPERYVLLPPLGASLIPEGDYYIEVVSQGVSPSGSTIGTGTSSGVITSAGQLHIAELGTPDEAGISQPVTLLAGQVKAYHFDVSPDALSLEVRFSTRTGDSGMVVLPGPLIPTPTGSYGHDGGNGGVPSVVGDGDALIVTASNPPPGKWSIVLNAGISVDAAGTLAIKVLGVKPVDFDGGAAVVTGHQPGTVRYYSVDVPIGAEGWDVRMTDLVGPVPVMAVRRDFVTGPPELTTPGWTPWTYTNWPSAFQTKAGVDWTGFTLDPGNVPVQPRLVSGMGRPLEPGKYFVGVYNNSTTVAIDYTIRSYGIGAGLTYPVSPLELLGGVANIDNLAPREARYYKVHIPESTPNWEVTLAVGTGDLELLARQGSVPDFAAINLGSVYVQNPLGAEVEMRKTGPERYVLLPLPGTDFVPAGDYYLAVVGEGTGGNGPIIGTGASSGVLSSGLLAVKDLGTASATGTIEPVQLESAQMKAYHFNVPAGTDSLEVRLDNVVGNAWVSLAAGTRLPNPPGVPIQSVPAVGTAPYNEYGTDGGNNGDANMRILTVANPTPGEWRVIVRGGHGAGPQFAFNSASADLVVTALSTVPLPFDGGTFSIAGQQPGTWRYFSVQVPATATGWDMRLRDVQGQIPAMMVRRDLLPTVPANLVPANIPNGWAPSTVTTWPSGNQWLGGVDWTGYALDAPGVSVPPRQVMGMRQPLEAGTYFVGVYNNTLAATSYTVESRGIGAGMIFPVVDLAFAGGSATVSDLPRREAQYFKVSIPANTPSWEVSLTSTVGEVSLLCRAGTVPDFAGKREGSVYSSSSGVEVKMQKAGPERYVLLPNTSQDLLPAGDYYLAVVSEGVNPAATIIGTGNAAGVLTSIGTLAVKNLGSATVAGTTEPVTLAGGQIKAYQVVVDPGTESLEVRLEGTVGYPAFSVASGSRLPVPPGAPPLGTPPHFEYGFDGGTSGTPAVNIYNMSNPAPGVWTVLVRARHDPTLAFPDAAANLVIRRKPNIPLNFDASLNVQGGSNTDSRQATDGEYNIYQIAVPPAVAGQSVLGWVIQTEVSQGAVTLEVYKDFANPTGGITIPTGVAIVVPPFLTVNSTWYVRVKATGLTSYKITSKPVTLERPAWQMPAAFNATFGDSGTDFAGNPLPGDRGIDLQQGYWHFYAVDVPPDNLGLLRTELQAISGNPDLYIREDGVPTINHMSNGVSGNTLAPRALTNSTTSYGNWVPFDGRTETRLRPGRWYIGVRAGGSSNVRYRLLFSTGTVKDLALDAASATAQLPNSVSAQTLPDNDWRYYRFVVPQGAPKNWTITFSQQVGDVVMWLRDTVPPGQKDTNAITFGHVASWFSDAKNQGPYLDGYDAAGAYTFATPPLRPGHVYYVGMRSNNSATFSLSSDDPGGAISIPPALDFYTGTLSVTVPANDSLLYRIPVPAEATRMKYTAIHSLAMKVRIEQGTLAATSGTQHFISGTNNSNLNQALVGAAWPWVPSQTYYVRFVNTSSVDEAISFTLNGKNAQNEDEDSDGLPDAWERQYFNNLAQTGTGDPDNDGVNNATELADGTAPNDANFAKYTLTVLAKNGSANATPVQTKYDKGTVVTLTNTPLAGYHLAGWSGGPLRGDDFALKATGTITIPSAGTWTFGINAADGARLKVNGTVVISDNLMHEAKDSFGQIGLAAGIYPIEIVAFERTGGEGLELSAAPGSFTSFNANFRLVGDVTNGGLAVQTIVSGATIDGFTVRQVEAASATINGLLAADNLLSGLTPARQDITGVIDVLNFLTYDLSEGHFADNVDFPITSGILDNPFQLTMNGSYTITALNSIALDTALDTVGLQWTTGSNLPWLGENDPLAFDTVDAAGSGPIADNQASAIQTTVTGPGVLTFKWKVSSLSGDGLAFIVDGTPNVSITGEVAWATRTYNVTVGVHTLTWQYSKNASGVAGSDRGWLDQVVFTPQ